MIAVIGAGIIGLSAAWKLARHGERVVVFDSGKAANEASNAAAGMLAPGGEIDSDASLAAMALRSLRMYPEFLRDLEEDSGIAVEFRRCGAIEVAPDEARVARQAAIGIRSQPCEFHGQPARLYPDDAAVDPRSVNEALLAACRVRGVEIRERKRVTSKPSAEKVLIAAGAWSNDIMSGLPKCEPVRGHILEFQMPAGLIRTIVRSGHTYLLQRDSGAIIAGSTMERVGFNRVPDPAAAADLHRRAATLLPALAGVSPSDCWVGFRPALEGGPVIGRVGDTNVWTAYGHFRNGILLAPDTAETIAQQMTA